MGATALEANLQTSLKIVNHSNTFLFLKFLKFLLHLMPLVHQCLKLMALNTAKNLRNLKREIIFSE